MKKVNILLLLLLALQCSDKPTKIIRVIDPIQINSSETVRNGIDVLIEEEKINSALAKNQSEQKKQFDSYLKDQQTKLVSKMPEFSDPDKASQLKTSMKSTLNAYGFNDTEVAQVYDHRIVMLVNDAMKYRNLQKAKPNIAKKMTKPGKVFTSGVKQSKSEISSKARKEKLSRLKKSGSVKDATSIFLDMINKQ